MDIYGWTRLSKLWADDKIFSINHQLTKEFSATCIGYLDGKLFRILLCWQGGQGPDKNCKWWPCLKQCKGEEREKRPTWVQRTQLLWPVFLNRIFFLSSKPPSNVICGQFLFMDPRIWYSFVSDAVHFFKYWKRISLNIERELVLKKEMLHILHNGVEIKIGSDRSRKFWTKEESGDFFPSLSWNKEQQAVTHFEATTTTAGSLFNTIFKQNKLTSSKMPKSWIPEKMTTEQDDTIKWGQTS